MIASNKNHLHRSPYSNVQYDSNSPQDLSSKLWDISVAFSEIQKDTKITRQIFCVLYGNTIVDWNSNNVFDDEERK